MFDDLPPPLAGDAEVSKSGSSEEAANADHLRDSKRVESKGCVANGGVGYNASLAFKPRGVATGIGPAAPSKVRRKEHAVLNACTESRELEPFLLSDAQAVLSLAEDRIHKIEIPAGIVLEPSVFVQSFETKEPYDPAIPTDYEEILSNNINTACQKNLDRLNAEEVTRRRQKDALNSSLRQSAFERNDAQDIKALMQSPRRNVCNLPAWLTEQTAATGLVPVDGTALQQPASSTERTSDSTTAAAHVPALQSLDYSNLSNTLSVVGVKNSINALLDHLAMQLGADAYNSEILRKEQEHGCELLIVFEEQASSIQTYYSLAQGNARVLCLESGDTPEVKFVVQYNHF